MITDDRKFTVTFTGKFFVNARHGDIGKALDQVKEQFKEIKKVGIKIDPPSISTSITIKDLKVEEIKGGYFWEILKIISIIKSMVIFQRMVVSLRKNSSLGLRNRTRSDNKNDKIYMSWL